MLHSLSSSLLMLALSQDAVSMGLSVWLGLFANTYLCTLQCNEKELKEFWGSENSLSSFVPLKRNGGKLLRGTRRRLCVRSRESCR